MTPSADNLGKETDSYGRFPSRSERDQALTRLLRTREAIRTVEILGLGFTERELRGLVAHGDLVRRHRGVYLDGRTKPGKWTYLKAALLAAGPSAFLSHRTAAAARDYRAINPREIHVSVVADHTPRIPELKVHRCSEPARGEVTTVVGLRVATLPLVLVQLARTAGDEELQDLITAGERRSALDPGRVEAILAAHAREPGIGRLRALLAHHVSTPEGNSGLERDVWAWYYSQPDLPPPDETNVHIGPFEFDGLWRRRRLVLEIDSRNYHQARADMEKDRIKDAYVQKLGLRILRVTADRFSHDRPGIREDLLAFLVELAA